MNLNLETVGNTKKTTEIVEFECTEKQLKEVPLAKLKEIYTATFGIYPSGYHVDNPDYYLHAFKRELRFDRPLKHFIIYKR